MGVQMDQRVLAALQLYVLDQVIGGLRLQQAGHVLNADRIAAHFFQLLRHLHERLGGMDRAGGVGDGSFSDLAGALDGRDAGPQIAQIVQGVKDAENIHAGVSCFVDEALDHAIFIMPIAQQVLAAQQHLQARLGQQLAEGPQALPGVFVQEANTGVEGGAAPAFQGPIPGIVEVLTHRNHVFERHTSRQ